MPDLVLDLFAGPGGWSEACRELRLPEVGVELDAHACATRRAAGHLTIRTDITMLPVSLLPGPARGLIASPPCPPFSAGGKGTGRRVVDILAEGIARLMKGQDCREQIRAAITPIAVDAHRRRYPRHETPDVTADVVEISLVLEAARMLPELIAGGLEWVAFEQVPAVLPLWEAYAEALRGLGWSAWAGKLNTARYGVPQTRVRAVLIASRDREVGEPAPTHREPMTAAQALGLSGTQWEHWILKSRRDSVNWITSDGERRNRTLAEPAVTITGEAHRWYLVGPDGQRERLTIQQAGQLQTFRPDFPWQGPRTRQFLQCGNAFPPLLARPVLEEASGVRADSLAVLAA